MLFRSGEAEGERLRGREMGREVEVVTCDHAGYDEGEDDQLEHPH